MKQIISAFILFIVLTLQIFGQNFENLEREIQAELKEKTAVGAAVVIVKGDKIVFSKNFGTANTETNAPVTAETLFQIGSITKTFTAALIVGLAEKGKLKLDAPIGVYAEKLSPKLSKTTFHQLLSRNAGVINEPDDFGAGDESLINTCGLSKKCEPPFLL